MRGETLAGWGEDARFSSLPFRITSAPICSQRRACVWFCQMNTRKCPVFPPTTCVCRNALKTFEYVQILPCTTLALRGYSVFCVCFAPFVQTSVHLLCCSSSFGAVYMLFFVRVQVVGTTVKPKTKDASAGREKQKHTGRHTP